MITFPEYLIKLTVGLSVLYVFYRLVLNRLTFYQWNRVYLLGYSLLSFVLPFVNISPWIEKQGMEPGTLDKIPVLGNYSLQSAGPGLSSPAVWLSIILLTGVFLLSVRMLLSYLSLRRIRKQAVLWQAGDGVRLFDTGVRINPFSFGRSIYLNKRLHTEDELQRIIQHEMVHVKQRHTIDLIIGELVCILNWYNPFAWLIRHAIRQNLEFIADKNVIDKGFDRKAYQYLLLKVVGLQQYSIVNNFSLPHLKKRIIMMNKMKSASLHLTRFLFALPLLSIVLLAFRSETLRTSGKLQTVRLISRQDTVPREKIVVGEPDNEPKTLVGRPANGKYHVSMVYDGSELIAIVKDRNQKIVRAISQADWEKNQAANERKYGTTIQFPHNSYPLPQIQLENRSAQSPDSQEVTVVGRKINQDTANRIGVLDVESTRVGALVVRMADSASSAKPLFVVDGKPQEPGFDVQSVPVHSIESINVWKGAAATGKYGDRAKNGVVEIKTKTPEQQKADSLQIRR